MTSATTFCVGRSAGRGRSVVDVPEPSFGTEAPTVCLGSPVRAELRGRGVSVELRRAGAVGGDLEALGSLVWRERPSKLHLAVRDQLVANRL